MSMYHDPFTGAQIRAHRTDPTGRHIPLSEHKPESWWIGYVVGICGGCILGLILFLGV